MVYERVSKFTKKVFLFILTLSFRTYIEIPKMTLSNPILVNACISNVHLNLYKVYICNYRVVYALFQGNHSQSLIFIISNKTTTLEQELRSCPFLSYSFFYKDLFNKGIHG